jgi:hypothetical protein
MEDWGLGEPGLSLLTRTGPYEVAGSEARGQQTSGQLIGAPSSAENVALDRPLACGLASHPGRILGAAGARRSSAGVVGRPWTRACSTSSAASRGALTGVSSSASAGFLIGPGKDKSRTGVSQLISVSI